MSTTKKTNHDNNGNNDKHITFKKEQTNNGNDNHNDNFHADDDTIKWMLSVRIILG